jgi:hypothetical protein
MQDNFSYQQQQKPWSAKSKLTWLAQEFVDEMGFIHIFHVILSELSWHETSFENTQVKSC